MCYIPITRGVRHSDVVELLPQHLIIPGFPTTEQATKSVKELINVLDNAGPKTPFTIGETQLHTIDILEKLFHNAQLQQPIATIGPSLVTTVALGCCSCAL